MKKKDLSALLTLLAVVFFGCGAALLFSKSRREPISRSAFLLNTFVNITLYDSQDEAILDHCAVKSARSIAASSFSEIRLLSISIS